MPRSRKISDAEWEVLKEIFRNPPRTAADIAKTLLARPGSSFGSPTTIKTLIHRLLVKRVISFEHRGRSNYYFPIWKKEDVWEDECNEFLERYFDGKLSKMVDYMIYIGISDFEELKQIVHDEEKRLME